MECNKILAQKINLYKPRLEPDSLRLLKEVAEVYKGARDEFGDLLDGLFTSCFQGDPQSIREALQRLSASGQGFDVSRVIAAYPAAGIYKVQNQQQAQTSFAARRRFSMEKEASSQIQRARELMDLARQNQRNFLEDIVGPQWGMELGDIDGFLAGKAVRAPRMAAFAPDKDDDKSQLQIRAKPEPNYGILKMLCSYPIETLLHAQNNPGELFLSVCILGDKGMLWEPAVYIQGDFSESVGYSCAALCPGHAVVVLLRYNLNAAQVLFVGSPPILPPVRSTRFKIPIDVVMKLLAVRDVDIYQLDVLDKFVQFCTPNVLVLLGNYQVIGSLGGEANKQVDATERNIQGPQEVFMASVKLLQSRYPQVRVIAAANQNCSATPAQFFEQIPAGFAAEVAVETPFMLQFGNSRILVQTKAQYSATRQASRGECYFTQRARDIAFQLREEQRIEKALESVSTDIGAQAEREEWIRHELNRIRADAPPVAQEAVGDAEEGPDKTSDLSLIADDLLCYYAGYLAQGTVSVAPLGAVRPVFSRMTEDWDILITSEPVGKLNLNVFGRKIVNLPPLRTAALLLGWEMGQSWAQFLELGQ